ncbi:carboxymuconolactone decarboxylase family protein [Amycolatopsis rhabdoformis]|uniref:Carboxymuconolactone decarboxylase family protein n=1 Tax=Amycolatopsis rhabdoformis TaxID=1448059 RepID=A0ABZ1HXC8_9PSEU|nr:carboxymuconolactone decarboxylase family protein [Amycolatopsis rhabdoformis]WSE26033.1 carboxymuconolactone decarboxylase family protein [Amycolatopsis rhabdoformis]
MIRLNPMDTEIGGKLAKRFAGVSSLLDRSTLPAEIRTLVQIRASQLNGCGFCLDMHIKDAVAAGETPVRLALVAAWRETTVYTDAERAALALTEEATRLADSTGISDDTWSHARKHFDDEQLSALVCLIGLINAANRMNVIVAMPGGSYEAGMFAGFAEN